MASVLISVVLSVGGMLLQRLFAPKPKDVYGSRLADINVPAVSPGNPVVRHWGTMKLTGQILWTSRLIEITHIEKQSSGGGKGGVMKGKSANNITYTYQVDIAIAICEGNVHQINRIWANQKLLWVNPLLADQQQQTFDEAYYAELDRLVNQNHVGSVDDAYASAFFFAFNNYRLDETTLQTGPEAIAYISSHPGTSLSPPVPPATSVAYDTVTRMMSSLNKDNVYQGFKVRFAGIDLYYGNEEQMPNAIIEGYLGAGNVPAYRGLCYFVAHSLQLEDFGNGIPTFNVEVQKTAGDVFIADIISDICQEAGLDSDEYDSLSYMDPDAKVKGYAITQTTSARDAITQLQKVFPFDGCETSYKVTFNWINRLPRAIIRREDMGAHIDGEQWPISEEVIRVHDYDLPQRINLKYQEPVRNYSTNTVFAERQITNANAILDEDVSVALARPDAKRWTEEILANRFNVRRTYKMRLPRKYVIIEPGDAVLVPDRYVPDQFYALRCVEVNVGINGICDFSFVDHNYHATTFAADTGTDLFDGEADPNATMLRGSPTYPYMLDCPLLTDSEPDNVGYYTILTGTRAGWGGGVLMIDLGAGGTVTAFGTSAAASSSGSNWYSVASNVVAVSHGHTLGVLPPGHAMCWDYASKLNVYLLDEDAVLYNASQADLLAQALNVCMVGDELLQFANCDALGNGMWQLSVLLRGIRGTEYAMATHVGGERFIRLQAAAVQRVVHDQVYLGVSGNYQAVTAGDEPDGSSTFSFTDTGNSLRPRAPQIHVYHRDTSSHDVYLEWLPRNRQNGNLTSGAPVVLDQPFELYDIEVYQGGTLKKTFSSISTRNWTYTGANQTSDGVTNTVDMTVRLYQIGQIIGRGFVSEITL